MKKVAGFINKFKFAVSAGIISSILTVMALASTSGDSEHLSAMETAFTAVRGDILSAIGIALPVGLGIMGTVIAIRFGIKFFKGVAK
jgi:hypothetical protein